MTNPEINDNPIYPPGKKTRFSLGSIVMFIAVLCAVGFIGLALFQKENSRPTSGLAPDFTVTTFDGSEITLSQMRDRIVVVNFWGSWCGPCRSEAKDLQRVYDRYQDDVVILGITYLDTRSDSMAFIERMNLTYPNAPDPDAEIARDKYHIRGAPESFIINRQGRIVHYELGPISEAKLTQLLEALLIEEQAA